MLHDRRIQLHVQLLAQALVAVSFSTVVSNVACDYERMHCVLYETSCLFLHVLLGFTVARHCRRKQQRPPRRSLQCSSRTILTRISGQGLLQETDTGSQHPSPCRRKCRNA